MVKQFTKEDQILSSDDMMSLVRLKRTNTVEYQETLRAIAEVLRDIQEVVEDVNKVKSEVLRDIQEVAEEANKENEHI